MTLTVILYKLNLHISFLLFLFICNLGIAQTEFNQQSIIQHSESLTNQQINNIIQKAYIKASNTGWGDNFGWSVSISGDTLVIGAYDESSNSTGIDGDETNDLASGSGAVYVFIKVEGEWQQQAYIKAFNTGMNDAFGYSVALSGDFLVVGAPSEGDFSKGAVYVFNRFNGIWSQQAYLKPRFSSSQFGYSVAIDGDTVVIGAYEQSSDSSGNSTGFGSPGAVYVYTRSEGVWTQQDLLMASNLGNDDFFGWSVAISGNTIVVGAAFEDSSSRGINSDGNNDTAENSGAAYIFTRINKVWSQQAYLKPSNTGAGDHFGWSVDISGDTVIVGAWVESSNALGVNGDGFNDLDYASGAAYVFERNGNVWNQQAYLKATTETFEFGWSVAVSGNRIVVGSFGDFDGSSGINNYDPSLFERRNSGAAFVFEREGDIWNQISYIKSSNSERYDRFGTSVDISAQQIIVGAAFEDSNSTGVNSDELNNSLSFSGAAYAFAIENSGFAMQAAHSALWYNPDQSGHGINVNLLENNRLVVVWYVYHEGKPIWLFGIGSHDGQKAMLDVNIYSGGMFPPNFDPDSLESIYWGNFELEFSDCDNGNFKWFPIHNNGFQEGQMHIIRSTNTLGLTCSM